MTTHPYTRCYCDDCRAARERAVTANAGRIRPLFSPPVVTPVAAVGGSTSEVPAC